MVEHKTSFYVLSKQHSGGLVERKQKQPTNKEHIYTACTCDHLIMHSVFYLYLCVSLLACVDTTMHMLCKHVLLLRNYFFPSITLPVYYLSGKSAMNLIK